MSLTLDLGALGLMIPMVESAAQARQIVDYARYAPVGSRGVAVYYADDIEPEGLPATLAKANREVVLMPQIETVAGVEHVEEIAAVDGVDVLWIGHYDLTTSLGTPGAFWNEAHTAAVERVFAAQPPRRQAGGLARERRRRCPAAAGDGLPRDRARRCAGDRQRPHLGVRRRAPALSATDPTRKNHPFSVGSGG